MKPSGIGLACVIPARGGSRRFPRKNIALLRGKPLVAYAIEAAMGSGLFPEVWVSTDDAEIAAIAKACGAAIHERPPALATDQATLVQVCLDFAEWLEGRGQRAEVVCMILPTAALLRPEDLRGGYALLAEWNADVSMAITSYLESPFWALENAGGYLRPFFGRNYLLPSQKLPEVWVDSGCFYFSRVAALRREGSLYPPNLVGYRIPRDRSIDIDEPAHLAIAEALLEMSLKGTRPEERE